MSTKIFLLSMGRVRKRGWLCWKRWTRLPPNSGPSTRCQQCSFWIRAFFKADSTPPSPLPLERGDPSPQPFSCFANSPPPLINLHELIQAHLGVISPGWSSHYPFLPLAAGSHPHGYERLWFWCHWRSAGKARSFHEGLARFRERLRRQRKSPNRFCWQCGDSVFSTRTQSKIILCFYIIIGKFSKYSKLMKCLALISRNFWIYYILLPFLK